MNLLSIIIVSAILLSIAYIFYGRFFLRWLRVDERKTPAHELRDDVDYVPASAAVVTGQHFSAIAAAGPIVGPILAGLYFGWAPALIWILLGSILIGGVHDVASLFASIRHKASSIAEVVKQRMSRPAYYVFLVFIWVSLVYVIIAFTDLTASSFAKTTIFPVSNSDGTTRNISILGGGVATAAVLYLLVSIVLGVGVRKLRLPLWVGCVVSVVLIGFAIWYGQKFAISWSSNNAINQKSWDIVLLAYCFLASILPMWLLLQPRGFLGSLFLYAVLFAGIVGTIIGGFTSKLEIQFPAWNPSGTMTPPGPLLPFLFITIACGACSGFHSIVSSGTTSKQLNREVDIRPVGYGAMLLEAMVAILALSTVMVLPMTTQLKNPDLIFAQGIGHCMSFLGIPLEFAIIFGLLAFSTFIFDTLDVCTRLGRYVFQELTGMTGKSAGIWATLATLTFPVVYLTLAPADTWKQFWTIFGTSNQLLAALTLTGVSVWLKSEGRNPLPALIPAIFMLAITGIALAYNLKSFGQKVFGVAVPSGNLIHVINFGIAAFLLVLSLYVTFEAIRAMRRQTVPVVRT
jgi:carbon starvation protein